MGSGVAGAPACPPFCASGDSTRAWSSPKAAARELSLPLHRKILRRTRDTRPQFSLQRGERARNIRGAFAADSALLQDARVLLVDDIMTSGATVNEAARCLRRAGARRVDVFVLARAEG